MMLRTTLGAVLLLTTGWGLWSAFAERRADALPMRPTDVRQRELLELNIGKPGDPTLGEMFAALNAQHFGGALPITPVRWEPRLDEVGALAGGAFTLEGMFGHVGKRTAILLNPHLQSDPRALERALSHEVVHAYLYSRGDPTSTHGAAFQDELRRLSREGAFEGVIADAEERASLRAWLDAESARLDEEHDALERLAAELERERAALEQDVAALNTRNAARDGSDRPTQADVDAINRRRDAFNDRAEKMRSRSARDTEDLAEFNRQVARYNLMIVYPDGVDEDTILQPKPADGVKSARRPE